MTQCATEFSLPSRQIAGCGLEAKQGAIAVLMQPLSDDHIFAVRRNRGRTKKWRQWLFINLSHLPDRLSGIGIQAGHQAGVSAEISLVGGDIDAFSHNCRHAQKQSVLGLKAP